MERAKSLAALRSKKIVAVSEKNKNGQEIMRYESVWSMQFAECVKWHQEVRRMDLSCSKSWSDSQERNFSRGVAAEVASGLEQSSSAAVQLNAIGEDVSSKLLKVIWLWSVKHPEKTAAELYNGAAKATLQGMFSGALWQSLAEPSYWAHLSFLCGFPIILAENTIYIYIYA